MRLFITLIFTIAALTLPTVAADSLKQDVAKDYDSYLSDLFVYFHENPELSHQEQKTAARLAKELQSQGFEVTTGVGGTGIVAIMKTAKAPWSWCGPIWMAFRFWRNPACPMPPR